MGFNTTKVFFHSSFSFPVSNKLITDKSFFFFFRNSYLMKMQHIFLSKSYLTGRFASVIKYDYRTFIKESNPARQSNLQYNFINDRMTD